MPYIRNREEIDALLVDLFPVMENVGDLNYVITRLTLHSLLDAGLKYENINNTFGTLVMSLMEMYRRVAAEYEDVKIRENGDVPEIIEITEKIRALATRLPANLSADTLQAHG